MTRTAIVTVADAKFFGAAAFVVNQLAGLDPPSGIDILLASDSAADMEKARAFGLPGTLMLLDPEVVPSDFPANDVVTRATYYRLCLPALLAERYDRILYLDADIYVHGRKVFDLASLDMEGNAVAAVRACLVSVLGVLPEEARDTIRNKQRKYLNAGVLLIDSSAFNDANLRSRIFRVIKDAPERMRFYDQSALNAVLDGDWLELSPAFNSVSIHWETFVRSVCEPVISHFAGSEKPWHGTKFALDHPARVDVERFLGRSPWSGLLARDFGSEDTRNLATGPSTAPAQASRRLSPEHRQRLAAYLRDTPFADVAQGVTDLKLQFLPASL